MRRAVTPYLIGLLNARTFYGGYVGIESVSVSENAKRLEARRHRRCNCSNGRTVPLCTYSDTVVSPLNERGIEIFPHGVGLRPVSLLVTENKFRADKDIAGLPDPNK